MSNSEPASGRFAVRNRTRGTTLADQVRIADTPASRLVGLLRETSLEPHEGLWIYPSQAVHTFGMRFPIDVAFLDRHRRIRRIYHELVPWRFTRLVWSARSVLELPAGVLARSGTEVGDELQFSLRENALGPEENDAAERDFALTAKDSE